jgi:ParB family transcriptional regulator, chromosome partitioning protein
MSACVQPDQKLANALMSDPQFFDDLASAQWLVAGTPSEGDEMTAEEDGIKPLPDRLVMELTAYRTLALREALAKDTDTAFVAVLHALCLAAFHPYGTHTCLEIAAKSAGFDAPAPGLNDSSLATAIDERHEHWAKRLPEDADALWDALLALDSDERMALFAHCASLSVNALHGRLHDAGDGDAT